MKDKIRKRVGQRPHTLQTDVYLSRKTHLGACIKRIQSLLAKYLLSIFNIRHPSVTIHGLGAALPKAIQLALMLQLKYTVQTSTEQLIDDLPNFQSQIRLNSAIHIQVFYETHSIG